MHIKKVVITNFKRFKEPFVVELNDGMNIIVGNNETGKSTILEAIHLALTGYLDGKHISTGINQYIFNKETVDEYVNNASKGIHCSPPKITIELYFDGEKKELAIWQGDDNCDGSTDASGIKFTIELDDNFQDIYEEFIKSSQIETLPIELYRYSWFSFCRDSNVTIKSLPIRSILVDSTSYVSRNSSDVYISRVIKGMLSPQDLIRISEAHRRVQENFQKEKIVEEINKNLNGTDSLTGKPIKLAVDLGTKGSWEESMLTEVGEFPFQYIGKGMQSSIRMEIAFATNRANKVDVVLLEEPENHLSHTNLNQMLEKLSGRFDSKQVICTTHSSFVANKLGIKNITLLENNRTVKFTDLDEDTQTFFSKLAGYDTLRFVLCNKAILVEGDSDELIVQKAYMDSHNNRLPIEDGIDVISVGTSFLRFLEIAKALHKETTIVTDNDGSVEKLEHKYEAYIGENEKEYIKICYDPVVQNGPLDNNDKKNNNNTLEPNLVRCNGLTLLNEILHKDCKTEACLVYYMQEEKVLSALRIFQSDTKITFPKYINDAIKN